MLDRAAAVDAPSAPPPLPLVRAGSVVDAKKARAQLQRLLRGLESGGLYLDALVAQARGKAIHLVLERPGGGYFRTWEAFCSCPAPHGLGIPAHVIDLVIAERSDPRAQARRVLGDGIPGQLRLGQRSHRRTADPTTAGTEGPKPGSGKDYLLARLARDHRDVLEAIERGEYPSVVAAARAAGILSRIVQLRPTPEAFARGALAHLDAAQIGRLVHYLTHPLDVPSSQSRPGNQAGRGRRRLRDPRAAQPDAA